MAEIHFAIRNQGMLTLRIDATKVSGTGSATRPVLCLPLELQMLPVNNQQEPIHYQLLRMAGVIKTKGDEVIAEFESIPMVEQSYDQPYYRQLQQDVPLDLPIIRRIEELRSGADPFFSFDFYGLVWLLNGTGFEKISAERLQLRIPRSLWADQVLSRWNVSNVKLVEIRFPNGIPGEHFRAAYTRVEEAEKHFANGQYKEVLTSLRLAFERLANDLGHNGRVKDCLESQFSDFDSEKRQKTTEALNSLYRFLHLGPHEQLPGPSATAGPNVSRRDARFALTMAHAVFEYMSPQD